MSFAEINSRSAVLAAIAEYDLLGRGTFLEKYGFGRSRHYHLVHNAREYDSKAIVGAAHGYQFPTLGPLPHTEFSGDAATVQPLLERMGFEVRVWKTNSGVTDAADSPMSTDIQNFNPMSSLPTPPKP
jgi:hypothetical protein